MQHGGKFEFFEDLINLLHSWSIFRLSLEKWHVGVIGDSGIGLIVLVDAKTELDHPVDAARMHGGVLKAEARAEERGLEEQEDKVLHRLVILVSLSALPQVLNDAVVGVDLQVLLGRHVAHGGGVPQSLSFHDPLHVGSPAILGGDNAARGRDKPVADNNLLHLLVDILHHLAQRLKLGLVRLFFFFSSSSSGSSRPSLVTLTRFFPSNSLSCCTTYSSIGSVM